MNRQGFASLGMTSQHLQQGLFTSLALVMTLIGGQQWAHWQQPAPAQPTPAKREDDWRSAALAASQKAAEKAKRERDEIPPPPEPYDYDEGEPEASIGNVPEYTREDEERDMADQARDEAGTADRRDATEVAMDLLAAELGAKPL